MPQSKSLNIPSDMELIKRFDDPEMRAVFGQIILFFDSFPLL